MHRTVRATPANTHKLCNAHASCTEQFAPCSTHCRHRITHTQQRVLLSLLGGQRFDLLLSRWRRQNISNANKNVKQNRTKQNIIITNIVCASGALIVSNAMKILLVFFFFQRMISCRLQLENSLPTEKLIICYTNEYNSPVRPSRLN